MSPAHPTLVAVAHGTRSPAGRRAVGGLVAAVRDRRPDLDVRAAFVDVQPPGPGAVLDGLGDAPARVVPLLLSAGFHVYVDLARAVAGRSAVSVSGALGPDERLATVLARRLEEAGLRDGDAVVLAAAGSSDPRAVEDCEAVAAHLGERLGRPVAPAYLSAAQPRVAEAVAAAREGSRRVAVATYLLAPGFFADRAGEAGADVVAPPLLPTDAPPPPELVDVVLDRYVS